MPTERLRAKYLRTCERSERSPSSPLPEFPMVATKRPPTVLAIDKDNRDIFVKFRASGITPLVATIDCLPMTFFGRGKTPYLRVQTALEWFEKELPCDPRNEKYKAAIATYRRIL